MRTPTCHFHLTKPRWSPALLPGLAPLWSNASKKARVHALARSADKLEALAARTGCIAHAIDVTDLAGLTCLFATQRFDILVNNAGVDKPGSILKADADGIDLLIDVNLRAVLHLAPGVAGDGRARLRAHHQHQLDCRSLQLWRQLDIPRDQSGGEHALAPVAHRCVRQARAGHRDLPRPRCHRHLAHVHGDSEETYKRFVEGFELPLAKDIADAIAFAICCADRGEHRPRKSPRPLQVPGGLSTARPQDYLG